MRLRRPRTGARRPRKPGVGPRFPSRDLQRSTLLDLAPKSRTKRSYVGSEHHRDRASAGGVETLKAPSMP
jgi:hypothetical protein